VQPYLERWDLLEIPTTKVPFDIPDAIRDAAAEVGLQDDHPEAARCIRKPKRRRPPR